MSLYVQVYCFVGYNKYLPLNLHLKNSKQFKVQTFCLPTSLNKTTLLITTVDTYLPSLGNKVMICLKLI